LREVGARNSTAAQTTAKPNRMKYRPRNRELKVGEVRDADRVAVVMMTLSR
jgi:hypothetical protein